jgi:hypothetical protein
MSKTSIYRVNKGRKQKKELLIPACRFHNNSEIEAFEDVM